MPLRGTQSFVDVFVRVWKRPGLLLREILWRWGTAIPLWLIAWRLGGRQLQQVRLDEPALAAITLFRSAEAVRALTQAADAVLAPAWHLLRWWLPLAVLVWTAVAAYTQVNLFRRLDPALHSPRSTAFTLTLLRSLGLLGAFSLWGLGFWSAWRLAVVAPVRAQAEPNLILYTALCVATTLLLFIGWSLVAWIFDAARLFALRDRTSPAQSLRSAVHAKVMRSKLVELNLVMGIVRVALLVLALVASATPLPFETVETAHFLHMWWIFVAGVFLLALDLFQVVRRSAGLYLLRALHPAGVLEPRS